MRMQIPTRKVPSMDHCRTSTLASPFLTSLSDRMLYFALEESKSSHCHCRFHSYSFKTPTSKTFRKLESGWELSALRQRSQLPSLACLDIFFKDFLVCIFKLYVYFSTLAWTQREEAWFIMNYFV